MSTERASVQSVRPPKALVRVANPILRVLLRSPLHRVASAGLVLLRFKGRRSGKTYEIPVAYHRLGGDPLTAFTRERWQRNFEGGTPLTVVLEGRTRRAGGELVRDPDEVAAGLQQALRKVGLGNSRRLGLQVDPEREPTLDELRAVAADAAIIRITVEED